MPKKLVSLLEKSHAPFEVVPHRVVFTAYDAAQTLKVKLAEIAKTLLVKIDRGYALVILSAEQNLDLKKLSKLTDAKKISFPKEKEVMAFIKSTKAPVSSFGSLYGIPVILEKKFSKARTAFFSAGSFTEAIRMKLADFIVLEQPAVAAFGVAKKFKKPKKPKKATVKKGAKKVVKKQTKARK